MSLDVTVNTPKPHVKSRKLVTTDIFDGYALPM
jgi:hypothetical protein